MVVKKNFTMYFKDGFLVQYRAKHYFEHPTYKNLISEHGEIVKVKYNI